MGRRQHTTSRHKRASSSASSSHANKINQNNSNPTNSTSQHDSNELDLPSFSRHLHSVGLTIRDVANDGNCFFRAVSDQLYGTEQSHQKLRQRACDYMIRHKESFHHFVDDEQSFDDYVNKMRTDGIWADHLELQAISMACKVNIRVHQSGKPSYDIKNHRSRNSPVIHLSYHFGEHYASVRPLSTAQLTVPAQHDPLPITNSSSPLPSSDIDHTAERRAERHSAREKRREKQTKHQHHHDQDDQPTCARCMKERDPIAALWKKTEQTYREVHTSLERTKRQARQIRSSEAPTDIADDIHENAHRVERELRNSRAQLEIVAERIAQGKTEHQQRIQADNALLSSHNSHLNLRAAANGFESDSSTTVSNEKHSSYHHLSDDSDEESYRRAVKRRVADIQYSLDQVENLVRVSNETIESLSAQLNPPTTKHVRGGKKKEQEAKRKARKERKRKEQQRIANGEPPQGEAQFFPVHNQHDIVI